MAEVLEVNAGTRGSVAAVMEIPTIGAALGSPLPLGGGRLYQLTISWADAGQTFWPPEGFYGFSSVTVSEMPQPAEVSAIAASFVKRESKHAVSSITVPGVMQGTVLVKDVSFVKQ